MHRERAVYHALNKSATLKGCVPVYYFSRDGSIYLEYIQGCPLYTHLTNTEMTTLQLQQAKAALRRTLQLLHEIGISHGDFQPMNVIVRPDFWKRSISQDTDLVILDFGKACFKRKARNWKRDMEGDLEDLDCIFAIANEKLASTKHLFNVPC